jgi:hypothetical protein
MTETNLIEDLRLLSPPDLRWLLAVLAAAVLALVGLGLWRRLARRAALPGPPTVAGAPPWETALAALERLSPLLRPESSRDYGMAATTVLRGYIEDRYGLHAPRLATEEFLVTAAGSGALPASHRASLGRFLSGCDLFKFGRFTGTPEELRALHAAAVDFVLASRPGATTNNGSAAP